MLLYPDMDTATQRPPTFSIFKGLCDDKISGVFSAFRFFFG